MLTSGKRQHFLQPSSRYQVSVPVIAPEQFTPPTADIVLTRKASYRTYRPSPRPTSNRKKKKPAQSSSSPAPQEVQK